LRSSQKRKIARIRPKIEPNDSCLLLYNSSAYIVRGKKDIFAKEQGFFCRKSGSEVHIEEKTKIVQPWKKREKAVALAEYVFIQNTSDFFRSRIN